jgi:hypothetical protein
MGFLKTLVKLMGDGCIIFSIPLIVIGAFGLAGSDITFIMGGRQVTPQEGGRITLIVGIILLLVGIVITYIRRKKME